MEEICGWDHEATASLVLGTRDTQEMYAKTRRGEITRFTGIDDPIEPPGSPEIARDTVQTSPEQSARPILSLVRPRGFVREDREENTQE